MKNTKQLIAFALVGLLMAGAGGGGVWWWQSRQPKPVVGAAATAAAATAAEAKPAADKQEYKYLTLDKVIVMLRNQSGEPMSHYLAVDLVFKTAVEKEKTVKEHLPLLRSLAVRSLSTYTLDKALGMTIEQFASDINAAYQAGYAQDPHGKPFTEALIGKLIIE